MDLEATGVDLPTRGPEEMMTIPTDLVGEYDEMRGDHERGGQWEMKSFGYDEYYYCD